MEEIKSNENEKKQFVVYMIFAFAIAWALQITASMLYLKGNVTIYTQLLSLLMFAPFLAVLIARVPLKGMGWIPDFKGKKWIYYVVAWLFPALLALLGAALYFAIKPEAFDLSCQMLVLSLTSEQKAAIEAQGITPFWIAIIMMVSAVTYAPVINMLFALGEEVGWRGYMYVYIKEKFGKVKGRIIGGIIWGIWHWPLMFLVGYEYGKEYWGWPVVGPIVFCVFTVCAGILADWVYEKTHCIWVPSLLHGAINASVFGMYFLNPEYANDMILGPGVIGVISGIPMVITAFVICMKKLRNNFIQARASALDNV